MLIDLILNRKEGVKYNAKTFYDDIARYNFDCYNNVLQALDSGENIDIQRALMNYIIEEEYNLKIVDYIIRQN